MFGDGPCRPDPEVLRRSEGSIARSMQRRSRILRPTLFFEYAHVFKWVRPQLIKQLRVDDVGRRDFRGEILAGIIPMVVSALEEESAIGALAKAREEVDVVHSLSSGYVFKRSGQRISPVLWKPPRVHSSEIVVVAHIDG